MLARAVVGRTTLQSHNMRMPLQTVEVPRWHWTTPSRAPPSLPFLGLSSPMSVSKVFVKALVGQDSCHKSGRITVKPYLLPS